MCVAHNQVDLIYLSFSFYCHISLYAAKIFPFIIDKLKLQFLPPLISFILSFIILHYIVLYCIIYYFFFFYLPHFVLNSILERILEANVILSYWNHEINSPYITFVNWSPSLPFSSLLSEWYLHPLKSIRLLIIKLKDCYNFKK